MAKPNIIQLSEFDITQKIIESLSNVCTRAVLFSVKNESKDATDIDTIVPTDAIALQILGKVETQTGDVYKANVILNGLTVKEGSHLYIHDNIVERWAAGGTSGSHSVFIHRLQNE